MAGRSLGSHPHRRDHGERSVGWSFLSSLKAQLLPSVRGHPSCLGPAASRQERPLPLPPAGDQLSSAIRSLVRCPRQMFGSRARASKPGNYILPAANELLPHEPFLSPAGLQTARLSLEAGTLCTSAGTHPRAAALIKSHLRFLHVSCTPGISREGERPVDTDRRLQGRPLFPFVGGEMESPVHKLSGPGDALGAQAASGRS